MLELQFMASLLGLEGHARQSRLTECSDRAAVCRSAQSTFLKEHLAWWVPTFGKLLSMEGPGGFYGEVGGFLAAMIAAERSVWVCRRRASRSRQAPSSGRKSARAVIWGPLRWIALQGFSSHDHHRRVGAHMNIDESLELILKRRDVAADLFYLVFLDSFPEVQQYFAGVNLRRQAVLLTMALMVVKNHFTGDYPATGLYLQYLGTKHHERGIPQDLYSKFRVALLQTLESLHGSDWSEHLAAQWQQAIEKATEEMFKGYSEHVTI